MLKFKLSPPSYVCCARMCIYVMTVYSGIHNDLDMGSQ